jgi:hypothetical protein
MSLLFSMFLLFASYGIWGVVLHGMLAPRSNVGGRPLFFGFILFSDA